LDFCVKSRGNIIICSPQTFLVFPSTVEKEKVKTPRREKEKKRAESFGLWALLPAGPLPREGPVSFVNAGPSLSA
jgi:hypothetical protein